MYNDDIDGVTIDPLGQMCTPGSRGRHQTEGTISESETYGQPDSS
jgi:hypothetical protein